MSPERATLKIFNTTPCNKRSKGRPKRRWKDCIDEDFAILKVKNWRSIARRAEWKEFLMKAQAYKGGDWKYARIYNPQRCLRILVERCRKDSSQSDEVTPEAPSSSIFSSSYRTTPTRGF
ncbi:hypothetical protein TNCV_5029841 [Trichonephila clavipes]|nr:hypothetical protein TNCV_5029841 [Trichonephila clavipes]